MDNEQSKILEAAEALLRSSGNKTEAAKLLDIPRKTLHGRLDKGQRVGLLDNEFSPAQGAVNNGEVVGIISDLHIPFHHQDSLPFLRAVKAKFKWDRVVCAGDEVDQYALSQYPSDPVAMSAGDEHWAAIEALKPFYEEFPEVSVCTSNHTDRVFRKAFSAGIPRFMMKEYAELYEAPIGWRWADSWEYDGVVYVHGMNFGGIHAAYNAAVRLMKPVVHGHVHTGGGTHTVHHNKGVVGLNVGSLIDKDTYAAAYAKHMPVPLSLGCGVVEHGRQFYFIRMVVDANNRWIGEL